MRIEQKRTRKVTRVFLVDPFAIIRRTVCEWIDRTPDLIVCGQSEDAMGALKAVSKLKPDIVVTEMLDQKDLRFVRTLHKRHPRLPILVYSFGDETQYAPKALEAGADGFLIKAIKSEGLVEGIRRTLEGRIVLSPGIRYRLLAKCMRQRRRPSRLRQVHHHSAQPRRLASRD
jgi:DNA-binding NarL/FixJ family response regulator